MFKKFIIFSVVVFMLVMTGCKAPIRKAKDYGRPLPPGEHALRRITEPADMPDFTLAACDLTGLREGIGRSIHYLNKPSSRRHFPCSGITHEHTLASLKAFAALLDSGIVGRGLDAAIREQFDVYTSVGCDDVGTVLFTGYYTPIFDGSMKRTERFRYPLYRQPEDLIKDDDGQIIGRKLPSGQMEPYPSRAQLEKSGELAGRELVWLDDPFEVYVAQVQGSAKIRLPDGKLITVGYAANNGHEYKSVAQALIEDNKIPADKMSLTAMIDYFKANPDQIGQYISRNPRFVFFRISDTEPCGSLNEPVMRMRSIATDKSIFPRAALAFISTKLPRSGPEGIVKTDFTGFLLDQDTGGAIRAAGRCDVYMGQGDLAGRMAGQVYEEGRLYYLFLKDLPAAPENPESQQAIEPIRITRSIAAGCKVRCLRCRVKIVLDAALAAPVGILPRRLGLGLFARSHDDPAIRIGS